MCKSKVLFRMLLTIALCLTAGLAALPIVWGAVLFNASQLARLHGNIRADWLIEAANALPFSRHARYESAGLLLQAGKYDEASALLRTLVNGANSSPADRQMAFLAYARAHDVSSAIALMRRFPEDTVNTVASALLYRAINEASFETDDQLQNILASQILRSDITSRAFQQGMHFIRSATTDSAHSEGDRIKMAANWLATAKVNGREGATLRANADKQELVINGGFEQNPLPQHLPYGWKMANMATGGAWNLGLFVVGIDTVGPSFEDNALRIDGIWADTNTALEPARSGMLQQIALDSGRSYRVTFMYRTACMSQKNRAEWSIERDGVVYVGRFEPETTSKTIDWTGCSSQHSPWQKVEIETGMNRGNYRLLLLPQLQGAGSIWFDNFSVVIIDR